MGRSLNKEKKVVTEIKSIPEKEGRRKGRAGGRPNDKKRREYRGVKEELGKDNHE